MPDPQSHWPRRKMLRYLALGGFGTFAFRRSLVVLAEEKGRVTKEMIRQAEWISGLEFTDEKRELMLLGMNDLLESYDRLRAVPLANGDLPALSFRVLDTAPPTRLRARGAPETPPGPPPAASGPASETDVAFASLRELGGWLRAGHVTAVELARLFLGRLERHGPTLECVIETTEEMALAQAERADRELAAGRDRGPLHGIPWGAKDLLAVPGYRTTWGARPFENQRLTEKAAVVERLEQAGAVLVAKLTLGALAWGDTWYGGVTKNPWKPDQGSSGSSAGSASATAAGLVPFAIGSETWGSIVSPCTRCGASGLRPTFGRVSRHGAMALSWSMDKLGPIARSAEDCARVFSAMHGADERDPTSVDRPFVWPPRKPLERLRVGWIPKMFEPGDDESEMDEAQRARAEEWRALNRRSLDVLRGMGLDLVPFELPEELPVDAMSFILSAEAATVFDELTRSGRDDQLVRQVAMAWPNVFRQAQTIGAVEYLRANRVRRLLMRRMEEQIRDIDVYVTPPFGGWNLLLTNLTGHPSIVVPNGFRDSDGTPTSITFTGRLFGESAMLSLAAAYQARTEFHRRRPPAFID